MALAALQVWRRPLPEVLRENVMEPIGASSTWRWYGYENSWVDIDGQKVQSVSGGGHWGGGMFINAYDMARFGYLFLRNGKWKDRQIVSEKWIEMARTPGRDNKTYGLRELVSEHRPQAAAGGAGDRRPLRRQRRQHHLHRLGERHRRGVPLDQERRGAERRDRQDDVVDAGEDHRGPVRPRFRIASEPLILPAERASLAPGRFCRRLPCHCRPRRCDNETEHIDSRRPLLNSNVRTNFSLLRKDIMPLSLTVISLFQLLDSIALIGHRTRRRRQCRLNSHTAPRTGN